MIYLSLFLEFCRIGLFSVGGGLATIPFVYDLAARTGWIDAAEIPNFFAIAQIIPGASGINLGAYTGAETAGAAGAYLAALGLVFPSIIIITIVSFIYEQFKKNTISQAVFKGMRPASLGLIASAVLTLAVSVFYDAGAAAGAGDGVNAGVLSGVGVNFIAGLKLPECAVFIVLFVLIAVFKKHPALYVALGSLCGIALKL